MTSLIDSGSHGCIFHPSINACDGNIATEPDSKTHITKIQKYESAVTEIQIGKKIQQIPFYSHYFAPVIHHCNVKVTQLNYELIRQCKIMQDDFSHYSDSDQYMSSKIRYVGKYPLYRHIQNISNKQQRLCKLFNTHLHLLDACQKLIDNSIIHFDLKPNNIMFDEVQSIPIIIDFGISTNLPEPLTTEDPSSHQKYYVTNITYDYWCIDIFMLSHIVFEELFYANSIVTQNHLDSLFEQFHTSTLKNQLTPQELRTFAIEYRNYFSKYAMQRKTWTELYNEIIIYNKTWDNYSLALCCLYMCNKMNSSDPILEKYTDYLKKNVIMAMPKERHTLQQVREYMMSEIIHS